MSVCEHVTRSYFNCEDEGEAFWVVNLDDLRSYLGVGRKSESKRGAGLEHRHLPLGRHSLGQRVHGRTRLDGEDLVHLAERVLRRPQGRADARPKVQHRFWLKLFILELQMRHYRSV